MRLRKLELKDAPLMLEWMHDESVVKNLKDDFRTKTIEDCEKFIKKSENKETDMHLAIVSDEDEYMGTVSLKDIDRENKSTEFAITVRTCAMRRGYAWYAMKEIIKYAFEQYGLERVYWCVSKDNNRAVRFYDKYNFHETFDIPNFILERYKSINNLKWYSVLKGDWMIKRGSWM